MCCPRSRSSPASDTAGRQRIHRAPLQPGCASGRGRDGARHALAARLDSVPGGHDSPRAERHRHSGAGTPARPRLWRGAGTSTLASDVVDAINGDRLVDGLRTPFSITEVLLGVCAIVRPLAEEKNLVLNTTFPQIDGRLGYPSALSRVLLNLTTNALRYTERGSVAVGATEHSPTLIEFWIEDTGRGIPDNVLAMLFDGFRPGSVGIRFSSAGLGLAICRNLLEKMGSSLLVDTAVEEGTRFSFRIELPQA